ncbi:hypothetical protein GQ43DRAFT_317869 [Delitschia confertaspora ATCC 74209]|uniref:Uncharacterized protein n=1 Tax=Delitschia confertaspora ATCC 74209 TaxID=1513339 RepID=A0A9P4MT76_9PLEO|nr:hypothetical protein GQ43DRAFT_317869 [Delitschia confertaspora ATCC 74209]
MWFPTQPGDYDGSQEFPARPSFMRKTPVRSSGLQLSHNKYPYPATSFFHRGHRSSNCHQCRLKHRLLSRKIQFTDSRSIRKDDSILLAREQVSMHGLM